MRGTPHEVEKIVKQAAAMDGVSLPIWIEQEPGSSGKHTIDHYQRTVLNGYPVRGDKKTGSKEAMAEPVSSAAEAGNMKILVGAWNRKFLDEIDTFPNGAHDDQVDALSGAFGKLMKPRNVPKPL